MLLQKLVNSGTMSLLYFLWIMISIVGVIVCAKRPKLLNRNQLNWSVFGFFMPIIAIIIAYNIKPKITSEKKTSGSANDNKSLYSKIIGVLIIICMVFIFFRNITGAQHLETVDSIF